MLNPVRARMVREAVDWPWSSYRATAGFKQEVPWLTTEWLLSGFATNRKEAQDRYRLFIQQGKNQPSPCEQLKNQIYLGTDQFVEDMQSKIDPSQSLEDIPRKQKQSPPGPLSYYANRYAERDEAMAYAYLSGHYTLAEVGSWFGVSYAMVSRAVKALECKM